MRGERAGAEDDGRRAGDASDSSDFGGREDVLAVAVAFGVVSIPWTYAFVAELGIPLWPSFVAAASFSAAGGGLDGLLRSAAGNLAGIGYSAATIAAVAAGGGGDLALSVVVGAFMLAASLHAFLPVLSFTPATFLGYATLFGVHASGATTPGVPGLGGEVVAAAVAMLIGAGIGLGIERGASRLRASA